MKEKTMAYCRAGENCSLALLRAASDQYGFPLSKELIDSCGAVCSGFGIGGICSALVAAIISGKVWGYGLSDPFSRKTGLHRFDGRYWSIAGRNRCKNGFYGKKCIKGHVFWKNPCT